MGLKTKIDWCDSTWNPVTGCEHGCPYCYARGIAERFKGWDDSPDGYRCILDGTETHSILELTSQPYTVRKDGKRVPAPYPLGFTPTLHRYRLDIPQSWEEPRTVFVCSMADLFGDWVPMDWKIETLLACRQAPQHRYLFLTKNPTGYCLWPTEKHPLKDLPIRCDVEDLYTDNMWLGVTYTGREHLPGTTLDPKDWKSKDAGFTITGTDGWPGGRVGAGR